MLFFFPQEGQFCSGRPSGGLRPDCRAGAHDGQNHRVSKGTGSMILVRIFLWYWYVFRYLASESVLRQWVRKLQHKTRAQRQCRFSAVLIKPLRLLPLHVPLWPQERCNMNFKPNRQVELFHLTTLQHIRVTLKRSWGITRGSLSNAPLRPAALTTMSSTFIQC